MYRKIYFSNSNICTVRIKKVITVQYEMMNRRTDISYNYIREWPNPISRGLSLSFQNQLGGNFPLHKHFHIAPTLAAE